MRPSTWQHVLFTALCFATAAVQVALADDGSTNGKRFITTAHTVGSALLIPVGLILCLAGYRVIRVSAFLVGFIGGGGLTCYAVYTVTRSFSAAGWYSLIGLVAGGLFFGGVVTCIYHIGVFALGMLFGTMVAVTLHSTCLFNLWPAHPQIAFYGSIALLGLAFGALAVLLDRPVVVVATAFSGAFAAAYGVGHFAGHFPTPAFVQDAVKGNVDSVSTWTWVYLGAIAALWLTGVVVQLSSSRPHSRKSRRENELSYALLPTHDRRRPV